jgi:CCR4-NOT transcription complex subunit 2
LAGSLGSRNSSLNGVPSAGVQQQNGSISNGRFASSNIPVALSQVQLCLCVGILKIMQI